MPGMVSRLWRLLVTLWTALRSRFVRRHRQREDFPVIADPDTQTKLIGKSSPSLLFSLRRLWSLAPFASVDKAMGVVKGVLTTSTPPSQ